MKVNFTVKAVSTKNPGKYAICSMDDQWYSSFGDCPVKKGDQVSVEYVQNGDFKNITEINLLSGQNASSLIAPSSPDTNNQQRLIVRQSCLKAAVELICNNGNNNGEMVKQFEKSITDLVVAVAEEFENWVFR